MRIYSARDSDLWLTKLTRKSYQADKNDRRL